MANSTNSMILGTCLQLCPEKERKLRVKNKLIHPIERKLGMDAGKEYILIKSFSRSAAGNTSCCDPKQIRPPYICRRTTNYIVENVLFQYANGQRLLNLDWTTYHFVFDRLRALRQDMVIQKCDILEPTFNCDDIFIHVHILQVCVKFHLLANYIFTQTANNLNDSEKGTNSSTNSQFDQHINFSHLLECLKMILNYYEMLFTRSSDNESSIKINQILTNESRKVIDDTLIDMVVIYVLINIGSYHSYKWALELDDDIKRNEKVARALKMHRIYSERNYAALFKEMKKLSLLHLLAFHWSLPFIVKEMLFVMNSAYSSKNCRFPISYFHEMMLLDAQNEEKLIDYLKDLGIKITAASSGDKQNPDILTKHKNNTFVCFDKNSYNASMNTKWQDLPCINKQLGHYDLIAMILD